MTDEQVHQWYGHQGYDVRRSQYVRLALSGALLSVISSVACATVSQAWALASWVVTVVVAGLTIFVIFLLLIPLRHGPTACRAYGHSSWGHIVVAVALAILTGCAFALVFRHQRPFEVVALSACHAIPYLILALMSWVYWQPENFMTSARLSSLLLLSVAWSMLCMVWLCDSVIRLQPALFVAHFAYAVHALTLPWNIDWVRQHASPNQHWLNVIVLSGRIPIAILTGGSRSIYITDMRRGLKNM